MSEKEQVRRGDNEPLSPKRRRRAGRHVETMEYLDMLLRLLRAMGGRLADGDVEDFARAVTEVQQGLDDAVDFGVRGLRAQGYSWGDIGRPLGMTRQGARQRWGHVDAD